MPSWSIMSMWMVVMHGEFGELSGQPVIICDNKKDAEDEVKKLERTSEDYFGIYPNRIYSIKQVKVKLNQENWHEQQNSDSVK